MGGLWCGKLPKPFPSEHLHRESIPGGPTRPIPRSWHRQPESSSHRSRRVRPAVTQALGAVAFAAVAFAVGSALVVAGGTRALGAAGSGVSFGVSPPCCPRSALRQRVNVEVRELYLLRVGLRGDDAVFWSPLLLFGGGSLGVTGRAKGALAFGQALHASGQACGWRGRRGAVAPNTFAGLGPVLQPPSGLQRPDTGCLMCEADVGRLWKGLAPRSCEFSLSLLAGASLNLCPDTDMCRKEGGAGAASCTSVSASLGGSPASMPLGKGPADGEPQFGVNY